MFRRNGVKIGLMLECAYILCPSDLALCRLAITNEWSYAYHGVGR